VIVVDTSALVAIILQEPNGNACATILRDEEEVLISAGTIAEALIVATDRNFTSDMVALIEELSCEVVSVTAATAKRIGGIYERWGKGLHPAGLNLGDCFAYALAKERGCPLLYVGDDFAKTDVVSAL
jgi:ribonuclease VapC